MASYQFRNGESFESGFRKFRRKVEEDGVLQELKKRECYEKPSLKKKRMKAAARKRLMKEMSDEQNRLHELRTFHKKEPQVNTSDNDYYSEDNSTQQKKLSKKQETSYNRRSAK